MTPRRILHVFRAPVGGLFRHVLDAARGQIALGHEVGIFCDSATGGERAHAALEALRPGLALGVTRIDMKRLPHPADAAALASLTRLYRRIRPDVLHGHGSKGGAYARLASWPGLDRTTIRAYTPHGGSFNFDQGTFSHRAYMAAEKLLERRTDVFLFESDYVKKRFDSFIGRTDKLVRVIHNGIEEREFEPVALAPDPFDLVYIGELRDAKGVDTLIAALRLIRQDGGLRLTLLCVGAGPTEAAFQAQAKAAGVWDSIAFVPPQPIREALSRGRIMVVPSKKESLPYVILEAAAARQPLVSTNVGGIPEIFGPYSDDLIPADDPALMAAKIRSRIEEPEVARRERAATLSRHVHARFDIDTMVRGGLDAYEAALAVRRS